MGLKRIITHPTMNPNIDPNTFPGCSRAMRSISRTSGRMNLPPFSNYTTLGVFCSWPMFLTFTDTFDTSTPTVSPM